MSRSRPNFSTRTAEEDATRLEPNEQTGNFPGERAGLLQWPLIGPRHEDSVSTGLMGKRHSAPARALAGLSRLWHRQTSDGEQRERSEDQVAPQIPMSAGSLRDSSADKKDKNGRRRSIEESKKLGTFSGVFVPTTLNVLSILMFLRFGFILGQAGLLGILGEPSARDE